MHVVALNQLEHVATHNPQALGTPLSNQNPVRGVVATMLLVQVAAPDPHAAQVVPDTK